MPASPLEASAALAEILGRMRTGASVEARSDLAKQVGSLFSSDELSGSERPIAQAILEKLVGDVEHEVRHALAIHVRSCAILPPALARKIAADIDEIAIPFIRVSPALSDSDLLAIVRSGSAGKQTAVAVRETVSGEVSEALVATGNRDAVAAVLGNEGASIPEPAYHRILQDFAGDEAVQGLMVERPSLPLGVIERLIQAVSDVLRERLIENHDLPADLADELVGQAGERTLMEDSSPVPHGFDGGYLAARLYKSGRLTPTLLMRALCLGDARFFEVGIAMLAGIPIENAQTLVADRGPLGLRSLYDRAGLPPEFFRAFRAALDVHGESGVGGRQGWSAERIRTILERVMHEYDEACPADLEHLLSQMSRRILGRSDRRGRH